MRDSNGEVFGSLAATLPKGSNNATEFQALLLGLNLCKELKASKIVIEGDSTLVINAL